MGMLIDIVLGLLYAYLAASTLYLAVFAAASTLPARRVYPPTEPRLRFRLLFPAYKEDSVICASVASALRQQYPRELFTVCVITDHMQPDTEQRLAQLGAEVISLHAPQSSKALALTTAMLRTTGTYDYVVILDADNVVRPNYLQLVHDYLLATGHQALQTHRMAKNLNTPTAVLDAAIEEINNSIFRAGHTRLGLSSSLIGSGMVIAYDWFARHIARAQTTGEDKELEEMLLSQHIHIGYAAHIPVYDEKVQQNEALGQQRRRWIATQVALARLLWRRLGPALAQGNADYLLKAVETVIAPRSLLLALLSLMCVAVTLLSPLRSVVWWVLWIVLNFSLFIAIPARYRNRRLWDAVRRLPRFTLIMAGNLFKLRGASQTFIHTQHGEKEVTI